MIMMKYLLFREIEKKIKEIRKLVLFYFRKKNIRINYQRILEDNIEIYDLEKFDTKFWFSDK